jgi:ATP-binding cassette subfamily B protein/subfamily B ATP-binding cassette protein MsbA
MKNQNNIRFQRIVRAHLTEVKWQIALAALCMLGFTLTELLSPWPLKIIFDHVLLGRELPRSLAWLRGLMAEGARTAVLVISLSIILLAGFRGLFSYFQLFITSRLGYQFVYRLRRELFAHLQRLSLSYHNRARSGELLTRITSDTTTLRDVFTESALSFTSHLLTLSGMFAVMFLLNRKLSLIVLLTIPVLCYVLFAIYRRLRASARRQRERESRVATRISEVLRSVSLVQAFARERYEQERFENESSQTLAESIRTARLEAAAARAVEIISAVGLWAVVLFGAWLALAGQMTPGDVLIFTAYLTGMYKPLRQLARLSSQFSKAAASAERLAEILASEPEMPELRCGVRAVRLRGEVVFRQVTFHYGNERPVLKNISFSIEPGQRVALVGASGAGKSTIASLLLRFYDPQQGAILADGLDLRLYQRESLRRQIGVVLQDALLFGVSIRENIAYGKPEATAAEIEGAARLAFAHDFIAALPEGYDTIIGERGCTLSGGQRQRLCLARAIIKRPSILILDEPTSAIDAESARLIQQAVNRLQQGRTLIVISHQFAGIESFDQILVLRDGEIVERGTHAQLLRQQGWYCELFRMQGLEDVSLRSSACQAKTFVSR